MRTECINILKKYIIQALITNSGNSLFNIFDGLVQLMQTNWDSSPTTMAELRQNKKTKDKGDLLEHFAYLFFKHVYQNNQQRPSEVYLLNDAPDNVLSKLNLKRHDMGIDLLLRFDKVSFKPGAFPVTGTNTGPGPVAGAGAGPGAGTNTSTDRVSGIVSDSLENTEWCAVQVKYRKPNPYKQTFGVSWSDLSTFYALVNRSGPYRKHIVLTNSHYVRHIGKKEFKDQSICIGTLRNISRDEWTLMANLTSNFLSGNDAINKNTISSQTISADIPLLSISNDEMDTRCTRYEVGTDTGTGTDTSTNVDTDKCTDTGASTGAGTSPGASKDINTDTKVRMQPIIRKTLPIIKIKPRLSPGVLQDLKKNSDKSTSKTPKNVKPTIDELRKLRCAFYGQQEQEKEKEPQQPNTDTLVNEAKER